jgi:hypothetical protein
VSWPPSFVRLGLRELVPLLFKEGVGGGCRKELAGTPRLVGSTLRINAGRKESGLLWQPRFFGRALRSVTEHYEKLEYIHLNPVRAGLVKRASALVSRGAQKGDFQGRE